MSGTTNISDLRTDPIGNSGHNNIVLNANEKVQQPSLSDNRETPGINLDESTINQIVNGIQQAGMNGMTQLHSRDIPMNPSSISNDAQIQPNYIPPTPKQHVDYIEDHEETDDMIEKYNRNMNRNNSADEIYNELQVPILLAVLYFLFQLPFLRKLLCKYIPALFSSDGNLNFNGIVFKSVLFAITYYSLDKFVDIFSKF
jgi:hypothetical protein